MPAPFRRADRHRPLPVDRHERSRDARRSLERSRRSSDVQLDRLRSYWR
jgi:hypothetical protein